MKVPGYDPNYAALSYRKWWDVEHSGLDGAQMHWRGHRLVKWPGDVYSYAEAIQSSRPERLIECGTFEGGSALMFSDLGVDVLTIDIEDHIPGDDLAPCTRIVGSSLLVSTIDRAERFARGHRTMVVLDSHHTAIHVRAELKAYAPMVSPGCYLVVEDTNLAEMGQEVDNGGPLEAVRDFLGSQPKGRWAVDLSKQRWGMTFNPWGWLIREG